MSEHTVLQGDLGAFSIADVFGLLNMSRKSGLLRCRRQSEEKGIYWTDGDISFAISNLPEDSLGEFLVSRGRMTRAALEQASQKVSASTRLGKVLVRDRLLTPRDLWWAVQAQVQEIIYSLFQWRDGHFTFDEGVLSEHERIQSTTSTQNLIMEGIRRLDEWSRIRERIPDPSRIPVLRLSANEIAQRVELKDADRQVLALIDGQHTIRGITQASGLGEFETQLSLLGLLSAGYVDMRQEQRAPVSMAGFLDIDDDSALSEQIRHFNELYAKLFRSLAETLGAEARQRLDSLLERADFEGRELFASVRPDAEGRLPEQEILSNIAELPLEARSHHLVTALTNHLLAQFLEFGNLLDKDQKAELYRQVQEHQQRLEEGKHA